MDSEPETMTVVEFVSNVNDQDVVVTPDTPVNVGLSILLSLGFTSLSGPLFLAASCDSTLVFSSTPLLSFFISFSGIILLAIDQVGVVHCLKSAEEREVSVCESQSRQVCFRERGEKARERVSVCAKTSLTTLADFLVALPG